MESFGVILSFVVPSFEANKEMVQNAFKTAGIPEAFIPSERFPQKAFTAALKESIRGDDGFMVRHVTNTKTRVVSGLVREEKDDTNKNLKYDVCNIVTFNSETETMSGRNDFRYSSIQESYKEKRIQISSVEFCRKLKEFMLYAMAIEILCKKAYFVPNLYKDKADAIVKLFETLKAQQIVLEIELVKVDDGSETRKAIVNNFTNQTIEGLDEELEKCYQQRSDFDSGKCHFFKSSAFRNQLAKLDVLEQRLKAYVLAMKLTPEEDKPILDKLELLRSTLVKNIDLAGSISKTAKKKFSAIKV